MKKISYSISCILLQEFLNPVFKSHGFESVEFFHRGNGRKSAAKIYFSVPLTIEIRHHVEKNIGILFYSDVGENSLEFHFIKKDSFYYNVCEEEYNHEENPFQIKSYSLEPPPEELENAVEPFTELMRVDPRFVHILGDGDDHYFIMKKLGFCWVCSSIHDPPKKKEVVSFSHLFEICKSCFLQIENRCQLSSFNREASMTDNC